MVRRVFARARVRGAHDGSRLGARAGRTRRGHGGGDRFWLAAVGGGSVLQAVLDTLGATDRRVWSVDILGAVHEYEVLVDAHTSVVLQIITQPLTAMAPCTFMTKAKAEKIALAAVGGGTVVLAVLEKTDTPPDWSVDTVSANGSEYEVKVNACTGKVIAIIIGG